MTQGLIRKVKIDETLPKANIGYVQREKMNVETAVLGMAVNICARN